MVQAKINPLRVAWGELHDVCFDKLGHRAGADGAVFCLQGPPSMRYVQRMTLFPDDSLFVGVEWQRRMTLIVSFILGVLKAQSEKGLLVFVHTRAHTHTHRICVSHISAGPGCITNKSGIA